MTGGSALLRADLRGPRAGANLRAGNHIKGDQLSADTADTADPTGTPGQQPGPLRLMAVQAHPDDESSKGAATMARYVREGVDVLVVTCTGGEAGSILNPELEGTITPEEMPAVRQAEMAAAREILGVRQE